MNHEKQTDSQIPPLSTLGETIDRRPEAAAPWQDDLDLEGVELNAESSDVEATPRDRQLGAGAVLLGEHSNNLDHAIPDRTPEHSAKDLESRVWSLARIKRDSLVRIPGPYGEVQNRILEQTPAVAPNGGQTVFDWIISDNPSAVFAREDFGYRGYIDSSGPDHARAESVDDA